MVSVNLFLTYPEIHPLSACFVSLTFNIHIMYVYIGIVGYGVITTLVARVGTDAVNNSNSSVWTMITCIRDHPFCQQVYPRKQCWVFHARNYSFKKLEKKPRS